jgi:outer membrane protein OmpA-like peptidoglycan-associated protein
MSAYEEEVDEAPEFWTAYADLLLTVLVIFIVVATAQIAAARSGQEAQRELLAIGEARGRSKALIQAAVDAVKDDRLLSVDSATGIIRLESEVLFKQNEATINDPTVLREVATKVLPRLLSSPTIVTDLDAIAVEGHSSTDGDYNLNLALSSARAQAAASVLLDEIPALYRERLERYLISSGYSESHPILAGTEAQREDADRSRRMELHIRFKDARLKALLDSVNARRETNP